MPGINDDPEQVRPIVERAKEAGATFLGGVALHLRDEVKDVFFAWLQAKRPDLIPRYEQLYENRAYMRPEDRKQATRAVRGWSSSRIRRLEQRGSSAAGERVGGPGGGAEHATAARRRLPPGQDPPAQSSLF